MRPFRRLLRLDDPRAAVDDELQFHIDMRTEELRARGLSAAEARSEALRQFGDLEDARRYCREVDARGGRARRRAQWWRDAARDARLAMRGLRRQPAFTATVILTLALGIGAHVSMFGIADRLLLRPPEQVRDPHLVRRLYFTRFDDGEDRTQPQMSYPQYADLRAAMRSARGVAVFYSSEVPLGEGDATRQARVTLATPGFFSTLGVRPKLGRFFTPEEDTPPRGARVAVISDEMWRRDFGAAPDALGKTIVVARERLEVIGVAPPGFTGANLERVEAWVPLSALASQLIDGRWAAEPWYETRKLAWLRGIVRLADAGSVTTAELEATAGYRRALEARWSGARVDSLRPRVSLEPLLLERGPDRTPSSRLAVWLTGMSVVVLLIACANVANLLLARALRRRREIAVRIALGAGRGRLVAQLFIEGLILALLGGVGALLVAQWGGAWVREILIPDIAWGDSLVDARLLAFAIGATLVAGMLTGLVPALQASDLDLVGALKTGAREGGGRRALTRSALVVVQAALSVVLLAAAGLFLRSLHAARAVELGFSADRVLSVDLDVSSADYSPAQTIALYDEVYERLRRLPGVRSASLAVTEPFNTNIYIGIGLPGRDSLRLPESGGPRVNSVTPEFFETMGTRIVVGRAFTDQDRKGTPPVTIVNELMARTLWPGTSPLGACVILTDVEGTPCAEVIGVAQNARWSTLREEPTMQMYFAMRQQLWDFSRRVLFVRTNTAPAPLVRTVRHAVREVAPRILFADVEPIAANIEPEIRPWRLGASVFTVFGVLALALAALGLYGVIAYDVAQRTREMGLRLALGARAADVLRLVVGQGMRVSALGILAGGAITLVAGPWIAPLLFATAPRDPLVLGAVAGTLLAVSCAACLVPAWRATRVAPGVALRAE